MTTPKESSGTILGRRKLPARYAVIVMPLLLSIFMTFIVSLVSTLRGVGLADGFFRIWMSAWGLSWLAAFPCLLLVLPLVLPLVKKATGFFVEKA